MWFSAKQTMLEFEVMPKGNEFAHHSINLEAVVMLTAEVVGAQASGASLLSAISYRLVVLVRLRP
jgi:hypothetical protein